MTFLVEVFCLNVPPHLFAINGERWRTYILLAVSLLPVFIENWSLLRSKKYSRLDISLLRNRSLLNSVEEYRIYYERLALWTNIELSLVQSIRLPRNSFFSFLSLFQTRVTHGRDIMHTWTEGSISSFHFFPCCEETLKKIHLFQLALLWYVDYVSVFSSHHSGYYPRCRLYRAFSLVACTSTMSIRKCHSILRYNECFLHRHLTSRCNTCIVINHREENS